MSTPASELPGTEPPADPHFSLLRVSAGQRVLGACVILSALWLLVWWAL